MGSIISVCLTTALNGTLHVHVHLSQALRAGAEEVPMRERAGADCTPCVGLPRASSSKALDPALPGTVFESGQEQQKMRRFLLP